MYRQSTIFFLVILLSCFIFCFSQDRNLSISGNILGLSIAPGVSIEKHFHDRFSSEIGFGYSSTNNFINVSDPNGTQLDDKAHLFTFFLNNKYNCHYFSNFLTLSYSIGTSYFSSKIVAIDSILIWKSILLSPNISLRINHKKGPFIGFGICYFPIEINISGNNSSTTKLLPSFTIGWTLRHN